MFRDATRADQTEFLTLWAENLTELEKYGSEYTPDIPTMKALSSLFTAYIEGVLFGACVLYEPPGEGIQGASFAGESWGEPVIPQSKFGKIAYGWGIYIRPEHRKKGIAYHLSQNTSRKLKAMGFDTLQGDVLLENEPSLVAQKAIGWEPHSMIHVWRLEDH
jgi:GNAT superfamily N-acetyltransferase